MPLPFRDLLCGSHGTTVEIHQAPLRRRMRKDHAAATPIPGGMRPGAWRRIAHTELLRQGQGMQRCCSTLAAAAGQSSLEGGELWARIGVSGSRSTGCWWAYGELVRCCCCVSAAGELEDSGRVLTMERWYPVFDHGCWKPGFFSS